MRRAVGWIIALSMTVVVLVGAVVGAELVLRNTVPDRIAGEVREYLNLSDDHPVEVRMGGLFGVQMLGGAFRDVGIAVMAAPITADVRGDLFFETTSLPVRVSERELGDTIVGARFTQEELGAVLRLLSRGIGQELIIDGDELAIENSFTIFGQRIPLSVGFRASVNEGLIHIDPRSVDAGPLTVTIDQLRDIPGLGDLALGFDVCVADQIPAGVTLESIELSTTNTVRIDARIDPHLITNLELQEPGTCE